MFALIKNIIRILPKNDFKAKDHKYGVKKIANCQLRYTYTPFFVCLVAVALDVNNRLSAQLCFFDFEGSGLSEEKTSHKIRLTNFSKIIRGNDLKPLPNTYLKLNHFVNQKTINSIPEMYSILPILCLISLVI